jgi:hypothetical protein
MSAQKCGENDPLTLELKQRVEQMPQRILSGDGLLDTGEGGLQHFHAGFRKLRVFGPSEGRPIFGRRSALPFALAADRLRRARS